MNLPPLNQQMDLLRQGAVDIFNEEELAVRISRSLENNRPLLVKTGFDPTAPDLHLGHSVLVRKMRHFQQLGHRVVFLIGDFTGLIGDPTGRNKARLPLTTEEISRNADTYRKQIYKLLDEEKTIVDFNSRWLGSLSPVDIVKLASSSTVSRMLERDDFSGRYRRAEPIYIHELLYPLMQAYDSVFLRADVELGGTDQTFNLLLGRELQKSYGQEPQIVITMPLLEGLDGVQKMSKSLGNYIGITEPARIMFGKVMSITDELMFRYYELLSDVGLARIIEMKNEITGGTGHPMQMKLDLAEMICRDFHGLQAASAAREEFVRVFSSRELPEEMEEIQIKTPSSLIDILACAKLVASRGEAKRLFTQGGVSIDGSRVSDPETLINPGGNHVLRLGKKRFFRLN